MKKALESQDGSLFELGQLIGEEIRLFLKSEQYELMTEGEKYYRNRSDVQRKVVDVANRSNTKIEHPILKKLIDQKTSYLLSKDWTVDTADEEYGKVLNDIFDRRFRKKIKNMGKNAIKMGVAYLQPYFGENGKLEFMALPSTQVIPIWEDGEKERLFAFIRFYDQEVYEGLSKSKVRRAEFWWNGGVRRYRTNSFHDGDEVKLHVDKSYGKEENGWTEPHFVLNDKQPYNWERPPLLWLRYNEEELPLCYYIKELIDDINWQTSVTADVLRDVAKFIYILKNYGGTDLSEFVNDLKRYLAIKVTSDGGVEKLEPNLNIDAVMAFLEKQRRDLYDFASAVDTKDPELGNASGTAINFRYMDLDADCAALGNELQDTFQQAKLFIDDAINLAGKGDFEKSVFSVAFNMDMPVNETDIINNCKNSVGILSDRTIRKNHPWTVDVDEEEEQLEKEKQAKMQNYGSGMFGGTFEGGGVGGEE